MSALQAVLDSRMQDLLEKTKIFRSKILKTGSRREILQHDGLPTVITAVAMNLADAYQ